MKKHLIQPDDHQLFSATEFSLSELKILYNLLHKEIEDRNQKGEAVKSYNDLAVKLNYLITDF